QYLHYFDTSPTGYGVFGGANYAVFGGPLVDIACSTFTSPMRFLCCGGQSVGGAFLASCSAQKLDTGTSQAPVNAPALSGGRSHVCAPTLHARRVVLNG